MYTEWHANVQVKWNYFFARLHITVDQFVCSRLLHSCRKLHRHDQTGRVGKRYCLRKNVMGENIKTEHKD